MKVLVTGANGFIGKNLVVRLKELGIGQVLEIGRDSSPEVLDEMLKQANVIFHLAGINRPKNVHEFEEGNAALTSLIVDKLVEMKRVVPIIFTSSVQAELKNPYGESKAKAELTLQKYEEKTGALVHIYRLPNVFGKWSRPNYNSVVATFCYNIINDIEIEIHDPEASIDLIYIDDLCDILIRHVSEPSLSTQPLKPVRSITIGALASKLMEFKQNAGSLYVEKVGAGLTRALYSTYISFLHTENFSYTVPRYTDQRGDFVEFLKTKESGQFSFFTAHPGVTRGGHYHHSKTEKFLVLRGEALYRFRNILTDESYEIEVKDTDARVVETIPGWSHDITNTGKDELIVMLWANEVFDPNRPDTVSHKV